MFLEERLEVLQQRVAGSNLADIEHAVAKSVLA
jgi:hypothetical protein